MGKPKQKFLRGEEFSHRPAPLSPPEFWPKIGREGGRGESFRDFAPELGTSPSGHITGGILVISEVVNHAKRGLRTFEPC